MYRYLLLIPFLILASCKKSDPPPSNLKCYACEVHRINGSTFNRDTCIDKGAVPVWKDSAGNSLNFICNDK